LVEKEPSMEGRIMGMVLAPKRGETVTKRTTAEKT
jgi:hypothetical protein